MKIAGTIFEINVQNFTGPFDILLEGIKDDKIDIFEISISQITSSYFEYLRKLDHINLNVASEFLLMASLLLEIKSKKVLPQPESIELQMEEEEISNDLLSHLEEYKIFKHMAEHLKLKNASFHKVYSRYHREVLGPDKKDFYLKDVSLQDLVLAFKRVWDNTVEESNIKSIKDDEITLPQRIDEVVLMLKEKPDGVDFEHLFIRKTRLEVVVTFLAILELAKRGKIKLTQGRNFGGIRIFGN